MAASVSTVRVINDKPLEKVSVISRGQRISATNIFLNGHKIRISGSFQDIARQINRFRAGTGVTAEVHITKGQERLVLKTNKSKVSIVDKSGALAAYFNANKMGVGADKLIEIAGISKRSTPDLVYSRYDTKQRTDLLSHRLSEANITYLGTLDKSPIPQIMVADHGEVPDLMPLVIEDEVVDDTTPEELMLIRNAKIRAQLLEALKQSAEGVALEVVFRLGKKSKTITNKQSELIASIQTKLVESGLGETYLRRESESLGQQIADAIYAKKSMFSYSTYSLSETKINGAIDSTIRTIKLRELGAFASDVVASFKIDGYTISSYSTKRIKGEITIGLAKAQNIIFEDFYFDHKRIKTWISSEILTKAANQRKIIDNEIVLTANNARALTGVISRITELDYQTI